MIGGTRATVMVVIGAAFPLEAAAADHARPGASVFDAGIVGPLSVVLVLAVVGVLISLVAIALSGRTPRTMPTARALPPKLPPS